jgi:class 3 adenylate cyclase
MFELAITPSIGKKWLFPVDKPLLRIGRAAHCDVVITDQLVSREHCLLNFKKEGPFLEDLNSANGTFVNDKRVTEARLKPGDKIRLGLSDIVLHYRPDKADTQPKAAPPEKGPEKACEAPSGPAVLPEKPCLPPLALVSPNQTPPTILVAHPECSGMDELIDPLQEAGASIKRASSTAEFHAHLKGKPPDCILLCPRLQKTTEVVQEIRSHGLAVPIILLLDEPAWSETASLIKAGADDVLLRRDPGELLVRVRTMLELHRLRNETRQLSSNVEQRVSDEISEFERVNRLKRYLSPQIVAAVLSGEEAHVLKPTRREVTIVFADLRNFTHFSDISEPEEIIAMLHDFHSIYGDIIFEYDGTLERFAGDGVMVFFGAPVPLRDHAQRAVAMAVAVREKMKGLKKKWDKLGYPLDLAFGISTGYVFVGNIGFEGRMDYAAIGKTTNLAARLCSKAMGGQILISQKTFFYVEDIVEVEEIGALEVKGFSEPVKALNVTRLRTPYQPLPPEE